MIESSCKITDKSLEDLFEAAPISMEKVDFSFSE